jgi:hypothetical protein
MEWVTGKGAIQVRRMHYCQVASCALGAAVHCCAPRAGVGRHALHPCALDTTSCPTYDYCTPLLGTVLCISPVAAKVMVPAQLAHSGEEWRAGPSRSS